MPLRARLLPALLLLAAPAVAVPPPLPQIAANCDSPTYASDMLVCGDVSLRGLDARMRDTWTACNENPPARAAPLASPSGPCDRGGTVCSVNSSRPALGPTGTSNAAQVAVESGPAAMAH